MENLHPVFKKLLVLHGIQSEYKSMPEARLKILIIESEIIINDLMKQIADSMCDIRNNYSSEKLNHFKLCLEIIDKWKKTCRIEGINLEKMP